MKRLDPTAPIFVPTGILPIALPNNAQSNSEADKDNLERLSTTKQHENKRQRNVHRKKQIREDQAHSVHINESSQANIATIEREQSKEHQNIKNIHNNDHGMTTTSTVENEEIGDESKRLRRRKGKGEKGTQINNISQEQGLSESVVSVTEVNELINKPDSQKETKKSNRNKHQQRKQSTRSEVLGDNSQRRNQPPTTIINRRERRPEQPPEKTRNSLPSSRQRLPQRNRNHQEFPPVSGECQSNREQYENNLAIVPAPAPSPYLLALKKQSIAPITSEVSTAPASTNEPNDNHQQDNFSHLSLSQSSSSVNITPRNKVVTKLSKSTMDKLGPLWAQKLVDLKNKEEELAHAKEKELDQTENGESKNLKNQSNHASVVWNSILKPITPPVSNAIYFSLMAESDNETQVKLTSEKQKSSIGTTSSNTSYQENVIRHQSNLRTYDAHTWWKAVFANDCESIMDYIDHGFEWDVRYQMEDNSIDHEELKLSDSNVAVRNVDCIGLNVLHICAKYKLYTQTFFRLLTTKTAVVKNIEVKDRTYKRTILHFASECGNLEIVQEAVKMGIDMNYRDKSGDIALHLACKNGHLSVVQFLLGKNKSLRSNGSSSGGGGGYGENGSKINLRNKKGQTPLHLAAHRNITVLLLDYGADPTITDADGHCAVSLAAIRGDYQVLKALLACNTFKSLDQKRKHDPLDFAGFHLETSDESTTVKGISNNAGSKSGSIMSYSPPTLASPLHHVAKSGNLPCLRVLLDYGYYDVNGFDSPNGFTPLMYTCIYGHVESFILLLKHGAVTGCYVNQVANESHRLLMIERLGDEFLQSIESTLSISVGGGQTTSTTSTIDLQGMNEVALAGLFQQHRFIRQVSEYLRRCQWKNRFFSDYTSNGNKCNALTYLANSLSTIWMKPTKHPLDPTLPVKVWREEKKQEIFHIYLSTFVAMISSGVRLTKRFIDIFGSLLCKQELSKVGLYHDWPLSIQEGLLTPSQEVEESNYNNQTIATDDEEKTNILNVSTLTAESLLWNIFPKYMNEVRHEVSMKYFSCHNSTNASILHSEIDQIGDLAFIVQHRVILFSHSFLWRKQSPTIEEMISIGMMKQSTYQSLISGEYYNEGNFSVGDVEQEKKVYVMQLSHLSIEIVSLLIEYVEKGSFLEEFLYSSTDIDTLLALLFAANELLMGELQEVIERQLFRLKSQRILGQEVIEELMTTLSLPVLTKLNELEELWSMRHLYSNSNSHDGLSGILQPQIQLNGNESLSLSKIALIQREQHSQRRINDSRDNNTPEITCSGCHIESFSSWIEFLGVIDRYKQRIFSSGSSQSVQKSQLSVRCAVNHIKNLPKGSEEGNHKKNPSTSLNGDRFRFDIIEHHDITACPTCCRQLLMMFPKESTTEASYAKLPLYGTDHYQTIRNKVICSTNLHIFVNPIVASSILLQNYSQTAVMDKIDPSVNEAMKVHNQPSVPLSNENKHVKSQEGKEDNVTIVFPEIFQLPKPTSRTVVGNLSNSNTFDIDNELIQRCDKIRNYFVLLLKYRLPILYQDIQCHDTFLHQVDPEDVYPLEEDIHSNDVLVAGGSMQTSQIGCHRAFLLGSSEKFVAMMKFHKFQSCNNGQKVQEGWLSASQSNKWTEVVELNVIHRKVLRPLLEFIYTGTISISTCVDISGTIDFHILLYLARISDEYFIPSLAKQCCEVLSLVINPINVGEIFHYSFEHKLSGIGRMAAYSLLLLLCYSSQPVSCILDFDSSLTTEDFPKNEDGKVFAMKEDVDMLCNDFLNEVLLAIIQ